MKRIGLLLLFFGLFSCSVREKTPPQVILGAEQGIELQPAGWSDLKNFNGDDLKEAIPAFELSCQAVLEKPESLNAAKIKIEPAAYTKICRRFLAADMAETKDFKRFLVENFRPYLVLENLNPKGKFTSYFPSVSGA